MNRIDKKFKDLRKENKTGFVAYVTAGDPRPTLTPEIILSLEKAGADIVEVGVPFSDPLADGPVIQDAVARAISAGTTVKKVLRIVEDVRRKSQIPIVIFTYINPILRYGLEKFARDARAVGVDGILVLDLPPEESSDYKKTMRAHGLKTIYLIAPTSTESRIKLIARYCEGFVYCVSRTGVTGSGKTSLDELKKMCAAVRRYSKLPIAVGFGISGRDDIYAISKIADAVVVGSAIVRIIGDNRTNPAKKVYKFVSGLTRNL